MALVPEAAGLLTILPEPYRGPAWKVGHFIGFASIASRWYTAVWHTPPHFHHSTKDRKVLFWCLLLAVSTEAGQFAVLEEHNPSFWDVVLDMAGARAGLWVTRHTLNWLDR